MDFQIRVATNQAPPLIGHNVVTSDLALTEAVVRHSSPEVVEELSALGAEAGTGEAREHGMLANRHHPELTPYDRYGNRIDEVEFHPSWHWLMERAVGHGLQAAPWESGSAHAHVRRAAGFFAWSQTEPGHGCPDLDDVRGGPGAAGRRRDREAVDAAAGLDHLRSEPPADRPRRRAPLPAWG